MKLNPDTIRQESTWELRLHMNLRNGGALYQNRCVEHPRLHVTRSRASRKGPHVLRFFVTGDDRMFETLEAAVAVLNAQDEDREWEAAEPGKVEARA